ncbi:MAG: glycosyltransferase family 9 protein [Desulfuromonadaceae bacterium]|nr:glycosyltransferase family 9 protein [Desulfuromonadaceae bacterium]
MPTKILIIKLGYSETLDPEIGKVPSLGDVLRTTPILWAVKEKYPDSSITWLVTENAEALLQGNSLIDRVLVWDEFVPFQLMREKFDVLINLEKIAGVCALADMIDAWVKYGFRFEAVSGVYHGYEQGLNFISYIENKTLSALKGCWQQILIEMLGVVWKYQPYILGYKPQTTEKFDVGFNHEVGSKWPFKRMPTELWQELENRLAAIGYSVSWQKGTTNLNQYMDWLNSCRLIVSNDSLGMHLAFALNKKCICLFGPTDPSEVFLYQGASVITPDVNCNKMPCMATRCVTEEHCMHYFDLSKIENEIVRLISLKQFPSVPAPV